MTKNEAIALLRRDYENATRNIDQTSTVIMFGMMQADELSRLVPKGSRTAVLRDIAIQATARENNGVELSKGLKMALEGATLGGVQVQSYRSLAVSCRWRRRGLRLACRRGRKLFDLSSACRAGSPHRVAVAATTHRRRPIHRV